MTRSGAQQTASTASNTAFASGQPVANPPQSSLLYDAVAADAALPAFEIGAVELLTFYPNHTQWPDPMLRLKSHGWDTPEMAKVICFARGFGDYDTYKRRHDTMRQQVSKVMAHQFGAGAQETNHKQTILEMRISYNAAGYRPIPPKELSTRLPTLFELSRGVVNWPDLGPDRGLLAKAVLWASQHDQQQRYDISHIPMLAQREGWTHSTEVTAGAGGIVGWDARAKIRVEALMTRLGYRFS